MTKADLPFETEGDHADDGGDLLPATIQRNPKPGFDFLVDISTDVENEIWAGRTQEISPAPLPGLAPPVSSASPVSPVSIALRYVPDALILATGSLPQLISPLCGQLWENPESFAAAILDQLNNELVPRWIHVTVTHGNMQVTMEDRQPLWDNQQLIARLGAL